MAMVETGKLWVIRSTGLCIIHRDYSSNNSNLNVTLDSIIFSGFVSAIFSMIEVNGGNNVETIKMSNSEIHYKIKDDYILAFQLDSNSRIRRDIQIYLEKVSEILDGSATYLFEDEFFDPLEEKFLQIIDCIDNIFQHQSSDLLMREQEKISDILLNYLDGQLAVDQATKEIKILLSGMNLREMRKKLEKVIKELTIMIEQFNLEFDEYKDQKKKFKELLDNSFNWFELLKDLILK